jgi:hypothetical protein
MQMIRHIIGADGEQVIGCGACGEVAHLQAGEQHRCGAASFQTEILEPAEILDAKPDITLSK